MPSRETQTGDRRLARGPPGHGAPRSLHGRGAASTVAQRPPLEPACDVIRGGGLDAVIVARIQAQSGRELGLEAIGAVVLVRLGGCDGRADRSDVRYAS